MLRCIGAAEYGAVLVVGGAENVMLPRLPIELPPPARASASPGARANVRTVMPANRVRLRVISFTLTLCSAQYGAPGRLKPVASRAATNQLPTRHVQAPSIAEIFADGATTNGFQPDHANRIGPSL